MLLNFEAEAKGSRGQDRDRDQNFGLEALTSLIVTHALYYYYYMIDR